MIAGLEPYAEMKDSELSWLGVVPAHWKIKRAKMLLRRIDVRSSAGAEELLTVSSERGVVPRRTANVTMFQAESYAGHKLCWPGDLVINSLWAWGKGLGVSQHHGIVSTAYGVYRAWNAGEFIPRYLHELVRSPPFHWELQVRSKGVWISRLQLTDESFLNAPLLVPPADEQAAIVRFLDHADRRIRRAIAAKQKLIKLLEEQKQAIIHRAVTRGLDPEVRLKPSGVKWLGDVPEQWDILQLGRCLTRIEQGWSPVASEGELAENQWAVLTLSSVRRGTFDARAIKPISMAANVPARFEVKVGDFLLTRSNTRDRVGDACVVGNVRPMTILCDLVYRLSINSRLMDSMFLKFQLLGPMGRMQIEMDARGSSGTMPKVSQGHIRTWRVVAPPLNEQRRIVQIIDREIALVDVTIDHAKCEISLLREYRTRLIADIVTGKLDVREAAARLRDEIEPIDAAPDDELLDEDEIAGDEIAVSEAEGASA